jgi:hypothetical protein
LMVGDHTYCPMNLISDCTPDRRRKRNSLDAKAEAKRLQDRMEKSAAAPVPMYRFVKKTEKRVAGKTEERGGV